MVNKPKAIGTAAETAVVKHLLSCGFSPLEAHRNVLKGRYDEGDVWLRHPDHGLYIFEVKGGAAAKTASENQIAKWLEEAEVESDHAAALSGFLVVQRAGVGHANAGRWHAYTRVGELLRLTGGSTKLASLQEMAVVRLSLQDLVGLLGTPQRGTV